MKKRISLILGAIFILQGFVCAELVDNGTFESGMKGWEIRFSDTKFGKPVFKIVRGGFNTPKSLKIVSTNRFLPIYIIRNVKVPGAQTDYEITYSFKASSARLKQHLNIFIDYLSPNGKPIRSIENGNGWIIYGPVCLYLDNETERRGWVTRTATIPRISKKVGSLKIILDYAGARGTVLLDDFSLKQKKDKSIRAPLYFYNPFQTPLGKKAHEAMTKLFESKSPFIPRGDAYNKLMVLQSRILETLDRLTRLRFYFGQKPGCDLHEKLERLTREIEAIGALYGRLYLSRDKAGLGDYDKKVRALKGDLAALYAKSKARLVQRGVEGGAMEDAFKFEIPKRKLVISGDGVTNQFAFASTSKPYHFEMSKVFGDVQQVGCAHGLKLKVKKGKILFYHLEKFSKLAGEQGTEYLIPLFPFSNTYSKMSVTPEFRAANKTDPEIFYKQKVPAKPKCYDKFNLFHPGVRESSREVAALYGKALKGKKLLLVMNWEDHGPHRDGYGSVAKKEFQKYLKDKYATIAQLNKTWRTSRYKSFAEIAQPKMVAIVNSNYELVASLEDERISPLEYEFNYWKHKIYDEYCISVFDEFNKYNSDVSIMADHSHFLVDMGYDPIRFLKSSDMIHSHGRSCRSLFASAAFRSLGRYCKVKGATYEEQENVMNLPKRLGNERARRGAVISHIGRFADREYTLQAKWYSYTRGYFILQYGSGNWAHPAFDLTTFRYYSTGYPVGVDLVRRFEKEIRSSKKVASKLALLIPEATRYHQHSSSQTYEEIISAYRTLYADNYNFEYVPERVLLEGVEDLSGFDGLIIPFAPYLYKGVWEKITPWVKSGGTLVALGPCGIYDRFGFDNPESPTAKLMKVPFPEKDLKDWRWSRGGINWSLNEYGNVNDYKGKSRSWNWDYGKDIDAHKFGEGVIAVVTKRIIDIYRSDRAQAEFLKLLGNIKRMAYSPDTPAELTLRKTKTGRYYLFALNPNCDGPINGVVRLRGKFARVCDLGIGGFLVKSHYDAISGYTQFNIRLSPGNFTMFELD